MRTRGTLLLVILALVAACSGDDGSTATGATSATSEPEPSARVNDVQVLGSHNSYHLRPPDPVLETLSGFSPELATEIDYGHRPLTEQLETHAIRQFELDVYADPEGGRFAQRPALELVGLPVESEEPALEEPGFKVLHIVDVDFASSCPTLVDCLSEIESWSSANAGHAPIMVMVEAKTGSLPEQAEAAGVDISGVPVTFTEVLPFTRALFEDLEAEILSVFDTDQLITPDDVRGEAATLEEAVLAGDAWPSLEEARGEVLFSLVNTGEAREAYVGEADALQGRLMFTSSEEGRPDAGFVRVDDPVTESARIERLVEAGYLVRTRADVPGVDAVEGDTTRRDAAFASGAQYVSTDYYVADPGLGTGYVASLPGDGPVRCSPVRTGCDL